MHETFEGKGEGLPADYYIPAHHEYSVEYEEQGDHQSPDGHAREKEQGYDRSMYFTDS